MPKQKIVPCLWFDTQAEEAANFYVSVFKDAKINNVSHYPAAANEIHGKKAGSVMTVDFELKGQGYTALNGGPHFQFNEAISLQVLCDNQEEIDYYWEKLSEGGEKSVCGWLKDRYGLSWQIAPAIMMELYSEADPERAARVMAAMMKMKKLDIEALKNA